MADNQTINKIIGIVSSGTASLYLVGIKGFENILDATGTTTLQAKLVSLETTALSETDINEVISSNGMNVNT